MSYPKKKAHPHRESLEEVAKFMCEDLPLLQCSIHQCIAKTVPRSKKRTTAKKVTSPTQDPCPNCGVLYSSLWRSCTFKNVRRYFCNACGLRFKKGKFCPMCCKVYYDVDTNNQFWIQCSVCYNWTHKSCLLISGMAIYDRYGHYVCRNCV
eukprot:TRINITY_DN653_c0_g1_i2.p1 TRINITY_DN653_c0_g1~~TRINITY_DN653_c0_g1_i2.p1  ORF type:complete len:151 (-),score=17.81 TRINITY_DN653_c0_g1_i2:79-531(-)